MGTAIASVRSRLAGVAPALKVLSRSRWVIPTLLVTALLGGACSSSPGAVPAIRELTGVDHGADYKISIPRSWNGTLLLYSHGYIEQFTPGLHAKFRRAGAAPDPQSADWLLRHGFALAGSLYARPGWAVQTAIANQLHLVARFTRDVGRPLRVIAWGSSMGALITVALAELHPETFAGALAMCGVLSGTATALNTAGDAVFATWALVGHGRHPLAGGSWADLRAAVTTARSTAAGRARLVLAAALADLPGWQTGPAPALDDLAARVRAEIDGLTATIEVAASGQPGLLPLAGGNPLANIGVDYSALLASSSDATDVRAVYAAAGLSLADDLAGLAAARRLTANKAAATYLDQWYTPSGKLNAPVLTAHTIADPEAPAGNDTGYAHTVAASGHQAALAQVFVDRPGHCAFTPAETLTALQTLLTRVHDGRWPATDPAHLDSAARALGGTLNTIGNTPTPAAFMTAVPTPLPRTILYGPHG